MGTLSAPARTRGGGDALWREISQQWPSAWLNPQGTNRSGARLLHRTHVPNADVPMCSPETSTAGLGWAKELQRQQARRVERQEGWTRLLGQPALPLPPEKRQVGRMLSAKAVPNSVFTPIIYPLWSPHTSCSLALLGWAGSSRRVVTQH